MGSSTTKRECGERAQLGAWCLVLGLGKYPVFLSLGPKDDLELGNVEDANSVDRPLPQRHVRDLSNTT